MTLNQWINQQTDLEAEFFSDKSVRIHVVSENQLQELRSLTDYRLSSAYWYSAVLIPYVPNTSKAT